MLSKNNDTTTLQILRNFGDSTINTERELKYGKIYFTMLNMFVRRRQHMQMWRLLNNEFNRFPHLTKNFGLIFSRLLFVEMKIKIFALYKIITMMSSE